MQNKIIKENQQDFRGGLPSIIEKFSIEGLYGYRTIGLTSQYAATILIAKNGAGKTTLLGALDAFLRRQFGRLSAIEFSFITCKLQGVEEELKLSLEDVRSLTTISENSLLFKYAVSMSIDPSALLDFIANDYPSLRENSSLRGREYNDLMSNEIYHQIYTKVKYSTGEAKKICDRIAESLKNKNKNIDRIYEILKSTLGDTEIVYLPTYRRIELSIGASDEADRREFGPRKKSIQSKLGITRRGLHNPEMQFGISDISDRLYNLNQEILYNSNLGYRKISANIINELLSGIFDRFDFESASIPDKDSLSLFFSRIKDGGRRVGQVDDVTIPELDKIYTGEDISDKSNKFLIYFLSKLNTVIGATRGVELIVEEFISNCNRYLCGEDESASCPGRDIKKSLPSQDDKVLTLNKRNLRVNVERLSTSKRIPLDSLSSGEKQMISLFARLYLYPGKK